MGVYYYLVNDIKKHRIHYDNYVKQGNYRFNIEVQAAIVNYMFLNQGDNLRFTSENHDDIYDYEEVDLINYPFPADIIEFLKYLKGLK